MAQPIPHDRRWLELYAEQLSHTHAWVFLYAGSRDGRRYRVFECRCGVHKEEAGR